MTQFIILGLLIVLFFVVLREDVREWFDSFNIEPEDLNTPEQEEKAHKDAIVDMSEEGMNTMLLKHDNFFKETYW